MDRIFDKVIILVLCLAAALVHSSISTFLLVAFLVTISLSALFELSTLPFCLRALLPLVFCFLVALMPGFIFFLPLAAYDLFRLPRTLLKVAWAIPLLVVLALPDYAGSDPVILLTVVLLSVLGGFFSWRSKRTQFLLDTYRAKRDDLASASHKLELRNKDIQERQDLELKIATLNERSRIARDIHDNVGHLLTRSVLQVEALAVVHKDDKELASTLMQVKETLSTAFESVRSSVHGLHEEAYNLETHLDALAAENTKIEIRVDYRAEALPPGVAYSFLALVREALSNTERHSDATQMQIAVVEFPGLYQLTIKDNGSKEPERAGRSSEGGIGLSTMEERTRSLAGVFRTRYDKGFLVFASVPREESKQA